MMLVNRSNRTVGVFNEDKGNIIASHTNKSSKHELWKMDSGNFVEAIRDCWVSGWQPNFGPFCGPQNIGPIYQVDLLTIDEAAEFYFKNNGSGCPELDCYYKDI